MRNATIRSIVSAYDDPVVRAYCAVRFLILRQRFLEEIGQYLPADGAVLDIGCGCGRILRWFEPESRHARLHGSDISEKAIAWDQGHIPFAKFEVNGLSSLPYADASFDLVFAISVVTHFDEDLQLEWLAELRRVVRPGGLLLMTAVGEETARLKLSGEDLERFQEKGHFYSRVQAGGQHGLPEYYQDAFHTRSYVERVWSRFFRVRAFVRNGPFYLQDMVVLERVDEAGGASPSYEYLELPVCSIGRPTVGSTVTGERMGSFGAVFRPRGDTVEADLWVDGARALHVRADKESPEHPGKAYPIWPSASRCVYEVWVPIPGLARGPHTFRLTSGSEVVAASSTYFFTA